MCDAPAFVLRRLGRRAMGPETRAGNELVILMLVQAGDQEGEDANGGTIGSTVVDRIPNSSDRELADLHPDNKTAPFAYYVILTRLVYASPRRQLPS